MSVIRLALCITELNIGGAEKAFTELALRLDRGRFAPEVYILWPRRKHLGDSSFVPLLEQRGIPVHFLDVSGPLTFCQGVRHLARLLKAQKAGILLSFLFHANLLGRLAARRAGTARMISGIRVSEKEHSWRLLADRLTSRLVDRYLCVSRSVALFTEKEGKIPAEKIGVIPNGVGEFPLSCCAESSVPLADAPGKQILFAGRLAWQKGLDWILEFADVWLGPAAPEERHFWIAGEGPQKDKLLKLTASLHPETRQRIHFLGWRPDLPSLLKHADLFLLPSRYEGMPNVLLEAAQAGLAVLSSRCDGTDEILGAVDGPQTFAFGNQEEFAAKLNLLMADGALRTRLGHENANRVWKEFSYEKMVERYEEELIRLAARN